MTSTAGRLYFGPTAQPAIESTLAKPTVARARLQTRICTFGLCRELTGPLLRHWAVQPLQSALVVRRARNLEDFELPIHRRSGPIGFRFDPRNRDQALLAREIGERRVGKECRSR